MDDAAAMLQGRALGRKGQILQSGDGEVSNGCGSERSLRELKVDETVVVSVSR